MSKETFQTGLVWPPDSYKTPADVHLTPQQETQLAADIKTLAGSIQVGAASPSASVSVGSEHSVSLSTVDGKIQASISYQVTVSGPLDDLVFVFGPPAK